MGTGRLKGILSILIIVSLIAPAVTTVSFLSVSQVSASPGPDNYKNIVLGKALAYTLNGDATPPWRVYEVGDNPVIMAANTVDNGAVVAAGLAATARNGRWNSISNPYPNFDILLDKAFQWMVPGATTVLWYGEDTIDYDVYNDADACSQLITALGVLGYTVTNTVNTTFDNITSALLSGIDILVIPQMELGDAGTGGNPDELPDGVVDVIETYVRGGGGLLIMEGYDTFGYNYFWVQDKILKALDMGMYFQSDTVQDDINNWGGAPWQPLVNVDNTTWIGSAFENATGGATIGVYGASSLAEIRVPPPIDIRVKPGYRAAFPGTTVKYTVSVSVTGWSRENIDLSVDNVWPATLADNRFENVGLFERRETTLTVTIPSGTALGAEDEITVTATLESDPAESEEAKCKAISSMRIGPPVEDTYVTQWSVEYGGPLGDYFWMQVGSGSENNKRAYLKFDLSGIPEGLIPPDDVQIDDIRARIYLYNEVLPTYAAAGKDVSIYEVDDDTWAENDMLWEDNEPAKGALLDTTKVTEEDYWYSWDVTAHVIDEFRNDNIASFSLRAETENLEYPDSFPYYSFASSNATESWKHPYLIIGYDVSTWISPDYDGLPGGTLTYTVNVWNKGSENDNFDLYLENVWETTLAPTRIEHVEPIDIGTATLTVKIPEGATIGDNDTILVTVVSEGYSGVNDNSTCIARASSHVSAWEDSSTKGRDDPPHHLENSLWGRTSTIYVGRYRDGPERGWLKFDLRAFPAGMSIARANLYLNSYNTSGANVIVYGVDNDNWSEYTINWVNKPSIGTDNVLDTRAVFENDKWYSWDVTDFMTAEYAGDKVASFSLVDIGENIAPDHSALFSSKEYEENMPYLEILAVLPDREVRAYVDPIFQEGAIGDTLTYTVTVMNKGTLGDNYSLTVEETEPWDSTLSDNLLEVPAGENRTTTLSVTITGGDIYTIDDITITVTSQENSEVYDNIRCSAHRLEATRVLWGLIPHDPIYIDGNENFTPANGVTPSSGTENDPHVIEDWIISAENAHGIWIKNTTAYFVIRNCYVHDGGSNYIGIYFDNVRNGRVEDSVFENNSDGIYLNKSDNNTLTKNTTFFNENGILLYYSFNNRIYHNNFMNNTNQAHDNGTNYWDDGYPSGGNYWSDYTGMDANNDGIGDTPHDIPGDNNQDRYPLMYLSFETWVPYLPPWTNPVRLEVTSIEENAHVRVEITFPSTGFYVDWGSVTRIDDLTFSADAKVWAWNGYVLLIVIDASHTYDLGALPAVPPGIYEFIFKAWSTPIKSLQFVHPPPARVAALKWSYAVGCGGVAWVAPSPAVGADGTIYMGSDDGKLYALNPDGTLKWFYQTDDAIWSSPAIGANGTIYITGDGWHGRLYALDENGALRWTFGNVYGYSSPAIGPDGTIYVGSYDSYISSLSALHENGDLKWTFSTGLFGEQYPTVSRPAIGPDGTIYFTVFDWMEFPFDWAIRGYGPVGWIFALDENGTLKWVRWAGGTSPAVGADGTVYVASGRELIALNPDNTLKWSYVIGRACSSPAIGADNTIFVGGGKTLHALNPDGTLKWSYATGGIIGSSPAVGAGTVYVGSGDNKLYAFFENGTLMWMYETGGEVYSSPAIGADGTIYVGSNDGKLYAIGQRAKFSLATLDEVGLDVDLWLEEGSKLVVRFYDCWDGFQGENVVWSGSTPDHVVLLEDIPHPQDKAIEKARLDLTTDNTENVISTIASFVVRKVDLEARFMEIPMDWSLASPEEKVELEIEFSKIPMEWALAPP